MTKLIIHAGAPKTGTTSIQQTLYNNTDTLLREGVLYPKFSTWRLNHTPVTSGIARQEKHVGRMLKHLLRERGQNREAYYRCIIREIVESIDATNPSVVVISAEPLFGGPDCFDIQRLVSDLGSRMDEVKVVINLRHPGTHYLSVVQQKLKHSSSFKSPSPYRFRKAIEAYEKLGVRSVEVKAIEYLEGDVVKAFLSMLGVDMTGVETPTERSNVTISAEAMYLLQGRRRTRYPYQDDQLIPEMQRYLTWLKRADAAFNTKKPRLLDHVNASIIGQAYHDVMWLIDSYDSNARHWLGGDEPSSTRCGDHSIDPVVEEICRVDVGKAEAMSAWITERFSV
mgnify:CR=1 FL=1